MNIGRYSMYAYIEKCHFHAYCLVSLVLLHHCLEVLLKSVVWSRAPEWLFDAFYLSNGVIRFGIEINAWFKVRFAHQDDGDDTHTHINLYEQQQKNYPTNRIHHSQHCLIHMLIWFFNMCVRILFILFPILHVKSSHKSPSTKLCFENLRNNSGSGIVYSLKWRVVVNEGWWCGSIFLGKFCWLWW